MFFFSLSLKIIIRDNDWILHYNRDSRTAGLFTPGSEIPGTLCINIKISCQVIKPKTSTDVYETPTGLIQNFYAIQPSGDEFITENRATSGRDMKKHHLYLGL